MLMPTPMLMLMPMLLLPVVGWTLLPLCIYRGTLFLVDAMPMLLPLCICICICI